ncbi:MAG: 50S ribosomal protein L16 [Dehalococcoidia bacterium]|nr:50S ribosomal protein L16 [Chloroflexota bacterium]
MLQPKRVKFRKSQRGRRRGKAYSGNMVDFGEFGLQALEPAWITSRQIEAARRAIVHHIKRGGQVWIRIFPDKPVSARPPETRMGKGKGPVDHWVAVVKPGRVLFEIAGIREDMAREALRLASHKLPISTRMITKEQRIATEVTEKMNQKNLSVCSVAE